MTGLPLGNYTSQMFANIYLNELDQYAKHVLKCKYYFRYMDDIVIICENKVVITITIVTTIRLLTLTSTTTMIITTTIALEGLCSNIGSDYIIYGLCTVQVLDIKGGLFLLKINLSKYLM